MKQRIFVGSSGEGIDVCNELVAQHTPQFEMVPWKLIFTAGHTTIESLSIELANFDFGIFVFSADDDATLRGARVHLPADNVLFEVGRHDVPQSTMFWAVGRTTLLFRVGAQ